MRIEQLLYLVEIAQVGSISLAAERLHVSQPSISQAVFSLEEELGVKLFKRSRIGAQPTDAGKEIIMKAHEILNKVEELKESANIQSSMVTGKLSIAAVPSLCMSVLPKTLAFFKNKYPGVDLEIKEVGSIQIEQDVQNGKVDLGLVAIPSTAVKSKKHLIYETFMTGKVMACVGKQSPLSHQKTVSPSEIIKYPIVIFNPEFNMHVFINQLLSKYGEPNILLKSGNTEASKRLIAEGIAVGFYTDIALKIDPYVYMGEIIPINIIGENVGSSFCWIRSTSQVFSVPCREFLKELKAQSNQFQRLYKF